MNKRLGVADNWRSFRKTDGSLSFANGATQKLELRSKLWKPLSNLRMLKTPTDKISWAYKLPFVNSAIVNTENNILFYLLYFFA